MNKFTLGLGILLAVVFVILLFRTNDVDLPKNMIGEEVVLYRTAFNGKETDQVYIDVPFVSESAAVRHINIVLDLNDDGVITPSDDEANEWLVRNAVPIISAEESLRFPITLVDRSIGRSKEVEAMFFYSRTPLTAEAVQFGETNSDFTVERTRISSVEINNIDAALTIDELGNKRTGATVDKIVGMWGEALTIPTAYAQTDIDYDEDGRPDYYGFKHDDVPDTDQEYNECSPTGTSNALTWLADEHGFEDLMPEDTGSLIDELKGDLQWDSGTSDEDMVPGMQEFVDRHQLPIDVHQVGTQNDPDIHWKIYEELQKGQAIVVSLQFYKTDENGERKVAGGHVVTASGVSAGPDFRGIRFSDSATDNAETGSGELYTMEGNKLKGFWTDKDVEIEYVYAMSPNESVTDGSWSMPSGSDFLVGENHVLNPGGDVVSKGISRFGFFNSFVDHPGDHYVGDRFTVVASVVMRQDERQYMFYTKDDDTKGHYWHAATGPWTLDGVMTGGGSISPGRLVGRPTLTAVEGSRYRIEQTYECVEPGLAKVTYEANVTWAVESGGELAPYMARAYKEQLKPQASFTINSPFFQCLTTDASEIEESYTSLLPKESVCEGVEEDPEGKEIEVLKLGSECYPKVQFHEAGEFDPCKAPHWHGDKVFSLLGAEATDPGPDACGFGKVSEVEVVQIKIDLGTAARFLGGSLTDEAAGGGEVEIEFVDLELDYKTYEFEEEFTIEVDGVVEGE